MRYVGIDLAWSPKKPSALCVLNDTSIEELSFVHSIEEMVAKIVSFNEVMVGVDAPLKVCNQHGNRVVEQAFLEHFKHQIGILPINRTLLLRQFGHIKGEELAKALHAYGFSFGLKSKGFMEVYPHSLIAVYFNNYRTLPYKRKKGRKVDEIKKAMQTYQSYLAQEFTHPILKEDIAKLRGEGLKAYEDKLDAISSALTLSLCFNNRVPYRCFGNPNEGILLSPI